MRDSTLHAIMEAFTADAAAQLSAETAAGAEVPFEVVETEGRRGAVPLYCYRPLTEDFVARRVGLLGALPTYAPALRALAAHDRVVTYLSNLGEHRIPSEARVRSDAALVTFLGRVFSERSQFVFDPARFELAYGELERALYDGTFSTMVVAPLLGIALDPATSELALGEGLSLLRGDSLTEAPPEAVWGDGEEPHVLVVLTASESAEAPVSQARARFRRILTAVRLFERGGYALGPTAWARSDTGPWRAVPLGSTGRPRFLTLIRPEQEDELRAFCNLLARRAPGTGEMAWALARFEMGCERVAPFEALTDHLLALRALLEPEGPASGRLAQRLAVICARPQDRAPLAERTARAISLERAVIAGVAPGESGAHELAGEVAEQLRALLRDAVCGHLDADLVRVADELLAEAAAPVSVPG
jgi:hypothetical protein